MTKYNNKKVIIDETLAVKLSESGEKSYKTDVKIDDGTLTVSLQKI